MGAPCGAAKPPNPLTSVVLATMGVPSERPALVKQHRRAKGPQRFPA